MKVNKAIPVLDVAKRMTWLAFKACGGPTGSGWIQDNPDATEDQVWQNSLCRGDYPGADRRKKEARENPTKSQSDYVFGRMMKLYLKWNSEENTIDIPTGVPNREYQSWCSTFPTYESLFNAAMQSLD